jgi:low affinity Fe/Cu permease
MRELFRKAAHKTSEAVGTSWAFMLAVLIIVVWAISGPLFDFSDTWQLVINTGTTILTFLMVFLIQNTQNRDAHAIHLKLDELIKASKAARNILIDAEDMSDEEIERLKKEFDHFRMQKDERHPRSHKISEQ